MTNEPFLVYAIDATYSQEQNKYCSMDKNYNESIVRENYRYFGPLCQSPMLNLVALQYYFVVPVSPRSQYVFL